MKLSILILASSMIPSGVMAQISCGSSTAAMELCLERNTNAVVRGRCYACWGTILGRALLVTNQEECTAADKRACEAIQGCNSCSACASQVESRLECEIGQERDSSAGCSRVSCAAAREGTFAPVAAPGEDTAPTDNPYDELTDTPAEGDTEPPFVAPPPTDGTDAPVEGEIEDEFEGNATSRMPSASGGGSAPTPTAAPVPTAGASGVLAPITSTLVMASAYFMFMLLA